MSFKQFYNKRNTFEWKIKDSNFKDVEYSPYFKIGIYAFRVSCTFQYGLCWFHLRSYNFRLSHIRHSFSIIDSEGYEFLTTIGTPISGGVLMVLNDTYLKLHQFTEEHAFTIRFTLKLKERDISSIAQECFTHVVASDPLVAQDMNSITDTSSDARECSTQVVASDPLVVHDMSSNTDITFVGQESSTQVEASDLMVVKDMSSNTGVKPPRAQIRRAPSISSDSTLSTDTPQLPTGVTETPDVMERSNQTEESKPLLKENTSTNTETPDVVECSSQTEAPEPLLKEDMSTNTEEELTSMLQTLSNNFASFYKNETGSDYILSAGDSQFPVHRAVLSARSPFFKDMFLNETYENQSKETRVLHIQGTTLSDIIYYMYSGMIQGLTTDTAASMCNVAHKYKLTELKTACLEFLKSNLTVDNICDAALLADTHKKSDLEQVVLKFIEANLEEINESCKWRSLANDKPMLTNKLLFTVLLSSRNKHIKNVSSDRTN